ANDQLGGHRRPRLAWGPVRPAPRHESLVGAPARSNGQFWLCHVAESDRSAFHLYGFWAFVMFPGLRARVGAGLVGGGGGPVPRTQCRSRFLPVPHRDLARRMEHRRRPLGCPGSLVGMGLAVTADLWHLAFSSGPEGVGMANGRSGASL